MARKKNSNPIFPDVPEEFDKPIFMTREEMELDRLLTDNPRHHYARVIMPSSEERGEEDAT